MDILARQVGATLVVRGTVAAISRWGMWRVAGWLGAAALVAYYLGARYQARHAVPLLPSPDQERRRVPECEPQQDESRTLH